MFEKESQRSRRSLNAAEPQEAGAKSKEQLYEEESQEVGHTMNNKGLKRSPNEAEQRRQAQNNRGANRSPKSQDQTQNNRGVKRSPKRDGSEGTSSLRMVQSRDMGWGKIVSQRSLRNMWFLLFHGPLQLLHLLLELAGPGAAGT
ncbi:hypothetical protein NDU88_003521 [Pleurodeles waltl]|uniref:Uncharacterized protein n=1 Tax=Pleurodeles waltl TaxID=8319 RepID=A0AAV7TPZ4_PLEWA|nr:hypothetical protein NDU88_003521 [Pleurodeles waltl]